MVKGYPTSAQNGRLHSFVQRVGADIRQTLTIPDRGDFMKGLSVQAARLSAFIFFEQLSIYFGNVVIKTQSVKESFAK